MKETKENQKEKKTTNPFKTIKHLVKDPINTIAEADERKKEILPWLYGSIGLAVLSCGLSNIEPLGFLMFFGLVGVFGVMLFGFLLFVIKKAKQKFEALTCDKCNVMAEIKTPEDFAKYVKYTIGEHVAEYRGISHPASNDGVISKVEAKGSATVAVSIDLKCPNCGEVKRLIYTITPFKCSAVEEKVAVSQVEIVKMRLENNVKEVVKDYNDLIKRASFPYSIHSKKNPDYENRTKPQVGSGWIPRYNGVRIDYRKDVEEMVEAFFLENQLDGTIFDPNKPKKSK